MSTEEHLARGRVTDVAKRSREHLRDGGWWHSIDLGDHVTRGTTSLEDLKAYWEDLNFPPDLRGKRLLDIGCWDGFFSFEAERHGAEVLAIDCWRPPNFFKAREALRSKVEFREMTVYDISRKEIGAFDYVLFLGVLYHLRHPLLGLERVCEVAAGQAIIESHIIDDFFPSERPLMEFYQNSELAGQYDNWWGPSYDCLIRMTSAAGFVHSESLRRSHARVTIRASRKWEQGPVESDPTIEISNTFNSSTWESEVPVSGGQALWGCYAKGLPDDVTTRDIRLHVGPFGALPIFVGDCEFDGHMQINAVVPPGLDPGPADVWLETAGRRSNQSTLNLVDGSVW